MTGLAILVIVALWFVIVRWLVRKSSGRLPDRPWRKFAKIGMYALLIPLPLANEILGMTEADRLDRQMEALCKQDAGVKIFETVRVPATAFDTAERLIIGPFQTLDGGLSRRVVLNAYFIDSKTDTLKGRNSSSPGLMPKGRLSRYQTTIRRAADNKVLGEDVSYGRTGGDFTLNHPSQNHCPKPRSPYIVQSIFIKEM